MIQHNNQTNMNIKDYNMFLETYSGHTESRENLADSYLAVKDYENASKQYQAVFDKKPDAFKNYSQFGIALLNINEAQKAVEMLEKAIELDADNNSAHLGLAQAYQDLGKNDMSYEQYQIVLAKVPNLNTVRLDYANLLADMDKNTEAIVQYNQYIKAFPNDINGYKHIAQVYKKLNNYDKALENYLIAAKKDIDDIELKKDIAFCYHSKKDYSNAIKYYDQILEVQPDNYNAKYNKALALHATQKYQDAIDLYKELIAVKKDAAIKENLNNALVARGHELIKIEEYDEAMTDFKSAIKDGYTDGYAYFGMAKIYRAQGENAKASENYEKAISLDPERTQYSAEYSDFISSLYKPKASTASTNSKDELPAINIEIEEVENKTSTQEEKPAVSEVKTSSTDTIKQSEELILEGDNNFKSNNYDAAIKNYQDALQLSPNDAVTLLKIGNIYKIQEDNTKAINYYQKAIIVNPD